MALPLDQQTDEQLKERRAELVQQIDRGRYQLAHRVVGRDRTHAAAAVNEGRAERNQIDAILRGRGVDPVPPMPPPKWAKVADPKPDADSGSSESLSEDPVEPDGEVEVDANGAGELEAQALERQGKKVRRRHRRKGKDAKD